MPFEPGNNWWEARSSHGRKPKWDDIDEFRQACYDYLSWVEANPLEEAAVYQGVVQEKPIPKMRAMTVHGISNFLGITEVTWREYGANGHGLSSVVKEINGIMYDQKFAGAAAGLLKDNIIARDLGLADKQKSEHSGGINLSGMSDEQLKAIIDGIKS